MQSRLMSGIETITSVIIGYVVAVSAQLIIFPWFGIHIPFHDNILIATSFTGVSLIRGYFVRRLFERLALLKGDI